jgi:hypothetical protein
MIAEFVFSKTLTLSIGAPTLAFFAMLAILIARDALRNRRELRKMADDEDRLRPRRPEPIARCPHGLSIAEECPRCLERMKES